MKVLVIFLIDENNSCPCFRDIAVVANQQAFAQFMQKNYKYAEGNPEEGYILYDEYGSELGISFISTEYEILQEINI